MLNFCTISFILLCLWRTSIVAEVVDQNGTARTLSYVYNPGCDIPQCHYKDVNETLPNLVHIMAIGLEDTVHYLWSTYKLPCIIVAKTSKEAELNVNWTGLLEFQEGSISFTETPVQSIGLILTELWEFVDEHDEADMGNSGNPLRLDTFIWEDINSTLQFTEKLITAFPKASNDESIFLQNGSFKAQFSASGMSVASDEYPHLWFTSNSSQFKILLDSLLPEGKKSRFGLELMSVTSFAQEDKWEMSISTSINDEYSPGVFRVLHLSPLCPSNDTDCHSFLTWKPVASIGEKPTVANSSDATMSKYIMAVTGIPSSIATAYFNDTNASKIAWNMTFGTSGDGFYEKTSYTTWSLMLGIGNELPEKMSNVAIIVISVGLGTPLIIMLGGGSYLGYTRCRRRDDDLLLSQDSMH